MTGELTRQETQVMYHVARGLTDKQIAAVLKITESTVGQHRKGAYKKLGAHNVAQAVVAWLRIHPEYLHDRPSPAHT